MFVTLVFVDKLCLSDIKTLNDDEVNLKHFACLVLLEI